MAKKLELTDKRVAFGGTISELIEVLEHLAYEEGIGNFYVEKDEGDHSYFQAVCIDRANSRIFF